MANSVSKSASNRLRVIVLGSIVRLPMGGMTWHHLQYVLGLDRLGHDVYFLEDSDDVDWSCYDPTRHVSDRNPDYGLRFAADVFERVGLGDRWAYFDAHSAHSNGWFGPCADRIRDICATSEMLINLSASNPLRPWTREIPVRALIDTDPVFTQIRHLVDPDARLRASEHTIFFSFGENASRGNSLIPDDGHSWHATRQPIVLDAWPPTTGHEQGKFTTVMQWDSYPARDYAGRHYGMKSESFSPYMDLPKRTGEILELALGSANAPRNELRLHGWQLCNPLEVAADPWIYQRYLQESKAEFTVAKHGYVVSRSGWFSERSAAYLATGRPVATEETGFSDHLASGSGLIPFSTPDEALAAIEEISGNYAFHCTAARAVAEEYFDAHRVLNRLIDQSMNRL